MFQALKVGKLKEALNAYIGYEQLSEDKQEVASDVIGTILVMACNNFSYKNNHDDIDSRAYTITMEQMLAASDDKFDCFLYDNNLGMAFADMNSSHEATRASLLILHLIKAEQWTAKQLDDIQLKIPNSIARLAEIYTGLTLGVHESGAWGGRRILCSGDYPFRKLNQLALKNCSNISPIDYSKAEAEADLQKILESVIVA